MIDSNIEIDIIERFKKIFRSSGLSKSEFADSIEISHQSLNKYLKLQNSIQKISLRIFNAGYSIDWLYSGNGNPLLKTVEDKELSNIIKSYDYKIQNERIKEWIYRNYENIIEYEIARGFKRNEIQRIFDEGLDIPYLILRRIENSGCNLHWSLTGEGSQYADNVIGNKLNPDIK
jgi:transcriptional regulator with XRE-family HTH domain